MSVRQGLLALLEEQPRYGYQLRTEFEARTGATWPLNVGQVYTTLSRLERDGLVERAGDDGEGHALYRITEDGRREVLDWFRTPVDRTAPPRDELAIKLAIAVTVPGVDVPAIVQRQRTATVRALQDYTRLKREEARTDGLGPGLAWSLVLDSLIFAAEAEIRWLDHCETRLARAALGRPAPSRPADQQAPDPARQPARGGPAMTPRTAYQPAPGALPGAAGEPVLQLRDVARVHGSGPTAVAALRGVSLTVHPGELVAVMGPSGSGKSTLLTLAGGLDTPTGGEVLVEGTSLGSLSRRALARLRRRGIGYVFQDFNLIPALTAAENVALPRELDGVPGRRARQEALAALAELELPELADRFPDDMSGGQQQRVAIARAIVGERRLILADEPTGALDSETGEAVLRLLRARVDAGAGGVLVTHEARHAAWADRVVFLRDGAVVDDTGEPAAVDLLLERRW